MLRCMLHTVTCVTLASVRVHVLTDHVPLAGGCDYAGNVSGCKKALLCTSPGEARNRSIWLQAYYVLLARLPALA